MTTVLRVILVSAVFVWASAVGAQTITGNVHNGSTGQPAVGDDVILMRLAQGMQEEARTKTGSEGEFTLPIKSADAPYFVRVLHQGVNYDQTLTATNPVQVVVYNSVNKIPGLAGSLGIVHVESVESTLKITEMYAISNTSNPPVTQSRPDNFEITLPDRAEFDSVEVRSPRGIWVNASANPMSGAKGKYGINFPLRPGDTLFKFTYHMPYTGETTLHLHLAYPINKFGVMLPATMQFKALRLGTFKIVGGQGRQVAEAVVSPLAGDVPAFQIIGKGNIPELPSESKNRPPAVSSAPPQSQSTPSLSPVAAAVRAEDRSSKELWLLIGGSIVIIAIAVFAFWRLRRGTGPVASKGAEPASHLEALKEELFQLESERLHGSISAEDYAATKEALNQSIQRALTREKR